MPFTVCLLALTLLGACSLHEKTDCRSEPQLAAVVVSENSVATPAAPRSFEPTEPQATQPITETKAHGKEQIQALQARLKKAGFNPGPVDGIFGRKTKAALARLESACATLNDLLGTSAADAVQKPRSSQGLHPVSLSATSPQQIRVLQVRLKDAGFDPGPIDGIVGAKTKAALGRLQWGCAKTSS